MLHIVWFMDLHRSSGNIMAASDKEITGIVLHKQIGGYHVRRQHHEEGKEGIHISE